MLPQTELKVLNQFLNQFLQIKEALLGFCTMIKYILLGGAVELV